MRDERDRRRNSVRLMPAGAERLLELQRRTEEAQDALVEPLSPDERAELSRLLRRLVDHHRGGGE